MKLQDFSIETWATLQSPDASSGGYPSCTLLLNDVDSSILHLFRDRSGHCHLAIEAPETLPKHLDDPGVNGLGIQLVEYRFESGTTSRFIDLTCSISGYLEEFTEVVREIASEILVRNSSPAEAVEGVIRNWLTFWGKVSKDILSESDQIGLICELLVLERLCQIDPERAIQSWRGPLGEKYDFSFPNWSIEVKGTRRGVRVYTINGIEQLMPPNNKKLRFICFQLAASINEEAIHLTSLVKLIRDVQFESRPDLKIAFNKLLHSGNYNPLHEIHYRQCRFDILSAYSYDVDDNFPKLIPQMLTKALSARVLDVRYDLDLTSLEGGDFQAEIWSKYFEILA